MEVTHDRTGLQRNRDQIQSPIHFGSACPNNGRNSACEIGFKSVAWSNLPPWFQKVPCDWVFQAAALSTDRQCSAVLDRPNVKRADLFKAQPHGTNSAPGRLYAGKLSPKGRGLAVHLSISSSIASHAAIISPRIISE